MSFTFVGKEVEGDDFGINILDRATLNRLYNAADLYLIPSRWEGGPQSAMEAAACRCKILSVPIGVSRDILEPKSLFRTSVESAQRIADDIASGELNPTVQPQFDRWKASHTTTTLKRGLMELYQQIPDMEGFLKKRSKQRPPLPLVALSQGAFTIRRRISRTKLPAEVSWNHREGSNAALDRVMKNVGKILQDLGVNVLKEAGTKVEIVGLPQWKNSGAIRFQWVVPGMSKEELLEKASLIAPSVQDLVNLRRSGGCQHSIVIPFLNPSETNSEEPLVVGQGNQGSSLQVWEAIGEGRPVIYPENSAYYEQVFHAGLAYGEMADPSLLAEQARHMATELRELRCMPSLRTSARHLKALLGSRK